MAIGIVGGIPSGDTGNIMNYSRGIAPAKPVKIVPAPKPTVQFNQQAARVGIQRGMLPPPQPQVKLAAYQPPPPRPWREAEQERIDQGRSDRLPFQDVVDVFRDVQEDIVKLPRAPKTPFDPGRANMALARDKANQNAELAKSASVRYQTTRFAYDEDSGGYKRLTKDEYEKYRKEKQTSAEDRDRGVRVGTQMPDIPMSDGSVWVYLSGNTSLQADDRAESQSEVWARMSPQEKYEYVNLRIALRNMRRTAGVVSPIRQDKLELQPVTIPGMESRWLITKRLNDIAISAHHRWLIDQYRRDPNAKPVGGFYSGDKLGVTGSETPWDSIPAFVVWEEYLPDGTPGMKQIVPLDQAYDWLRANAMDDPYAAGQLIVAMALTNHIPGASQGFVQDYINFDENGVPIGNYNPADYDRSLRAFVQTIAARQEDIAQPGVATPGFWAVVEEQMARNQQVALAPTGPAPEGFGGGGGRGRGYGGGGGGYVERVFLTDPAIIGSVIDSIARSRFGAILTEEQKAAFVAHFHELERQYSAAYTAGGVAIQPNLEGQAVEWINKFFAEDQRMHAEGRFIAALQELIRTGSLGSVVGD